jgi:hypothetical protein
MITLTIGFDLFNTQLVLILNGLRFYFFLLYWSFLAPDFSPTRGNVKYRNIILNNNIQTNKKYKKGSFQG